MDHRADRVAAALKDGVGMRVQGKYGLTALHWAVMEDDTQAINILLDAGADPNWYWRVPNGTDVVGPPVWLAASKKHHDALRLLLKRGGNVNTVYQSSSALMAAVENRDLEAAKILLDAGADVNFQVDEFDTSTAMLPVSGGSNEEIALWLLDHGYNKGLERFRKMLLRRKAGFGQEALRERLIKRFDEAIETQAGRAGR
jgi:ankyrin repeat protein